MVRNFSPKDATAQRDADGHRTGLKILIRARVPMQPSSWKRWGIKQRVHISKSKFVYRYYSSSRAVGLKDGVPVEMFKDNKTLAAYLIDRFLLQDGMTYAIQGFTVGSSKTGIKFTRTLFMITVHSADGYKADIYKDGRLNRYFFRKEKKRARPE
jgi:hypothetical protein